jgi:hypothetical protein
MDGIKLKLGGMNNKARPESLPEGIARDAVNVQFDNAGRILMPRQGITLKFTGNCHSVYKGKNITLFVDAGMLKRLNDDGNGFAIGYVGNGGCYYCAVGDVVYFSNGERTGKVVNGGIREWGTPRPPFQPDCNPIAHGNMLGGDYRVSITWIADEESGTGMGKRVAVPEGGGIRLTNFPAPPPFVKKVAVYISAVNGKDMYLVGELDPSVTDVGIDNDIYTVPLQTQFGYPPAPQGKVVAHYGRIYYPRKNRLYWTALRRYGLQFANSYWAFDSDIQVVITCSNMLYIGTLNKIYRVSNIDAEGLSATVEALQECGAVKDSECYHPDGIRAFFMSHRGMVQATPEGLSEMTYDQVAIPFYESGATTLTQEDGLDYLVFVGKGGKPNPLQHVA